MLNILLNEFKDLTAELINLLEENNLELIEELLNKRQAVIGKIDLLEYSKEDFKKIVSELNLIEHESKLGNLLKTKLTDTKKEIDDNKAKMGNVTKQRAINKMYVNMNPLDPVFVSKKY